VNVHHLDRAKQDRPNLLSLALESLHRADVIKRLVAGAAQGNVDAFLGAAAQVTWAGGWVDALRALVPLKTVSDTIRDAFLGSWESTASQPLGLRRTLPCDLLGQAALLIDGLSVLLPPPQPTPAPATLYAVAPLNDYRAGDLGLWWTSEQSLAFTVSRAGAAFHEWGDGPLILLATNAPASAVVYAVDDLEVLLDPRRLGPVRVVGVLAENQGDALAA
jgi:hypothetical protein